MKFGRALRTQLSCQKANPGAALRLLYYRLDGVDAWRPPGVPARDGLVLLLMMYSSSRLV